MVIYNIRKKPKNPVLITVPHAGSFYPKLFKKYIKLDLDKIRKIEDYQSDKILKLIKKENVDILIAKCSRAVVDLNRSRKSIDNDMFNGIVIIGQPDEETVTVNELSKIVANETGYNGKPIYVSGRPQEVLEASCSSDKARKLLEYKTKTSLRDSVKLTADYIRKKGTKEFIYNLPVEIKTNKTPETWIKKTI